MSGGGALFRAEPRKFREQRLEGSVVLPAPQSSVWGLTLTLAVIAATAVLAVKGEYAPRQTVPGYLTPEGGLARINAVRFGRVQSVSVHDGDLVAPQQQLVSVSVEEGYKDTLGKTAPTRIMDEIITQEKNLLDSLANDHEVTKGNEQRLRARIASLEREQVELKAEFAALLAQKESTQSSLRKLQAMRDAGHITEFDLAFKKEQVYGLERESHTLARAMAVAEQSLADTRLELQQQPLQAKQRKAGIQSQLSDVRRQGAAMETERAYVLTAPIAGRVTALQVEVGKTVSFSQTLMMIVPPDAELNAHLMVPSQAIGFVKLGDSVRLRYAGYPYQQYGTYTGKVSEISGTTLRPEEWPTSLPAPIAAYRVTVKLDAQTVSARGEERLLQAGMTLEADLM